MSSESLYYLIIGILILQFAVETLLDYLNARKFGDPLPEEVANVYSSEAYDRSMAYKKANYRFGLFSGSLSLALTLAFLIFGGFEWVDQFAMGMSENPISRALLFFGIILLGSGLLSLPFSYYQTFVIEEAFGFNTSSPALWLTDRLKSTFLMVFLGGGLLLLVIWFYRWSGSGFWIYAWGAISIFTLFMNLFYSRLIVPLFNKQVPLEDSSLKSRIEAYSRKVGFELKNIFVIDGSKRSTKANAYFSGFGKEKRITLYDTLIKDLDESEIVAVLAHEVGHYKKKHIVFNLIVSILLTGFTLYLLSVFINHPELSRAIGVSTPSFHAALLSFGLLYSPISEITGLVMNYISRRFEYQADNFARETFAAEPLISSLKKLSRNNLSNLTPHPAYVFVHYSHPPLSRRIGNLKA
jgi:STE24 endopeptidase